MGKFLAGCLASVWTMGVLFAGVMIGFGLDEGYHADQEKRKYEHERERRFATSIHKFATYGGDNTPFKKGVAEDAGTEE